MKEGWKYTKLGGVFKTYAGGTPQKSHKEYYDGGNIPWLMSGEVCQKYICKTECFITEEGLKNSSAKYYPINTVVVAMYGATAAQVGILKVEATSNQAVCGILPNKDFLPEFIYYWFVHIKEILAAQAQGGAQPNLSQVKIKNVEIPFISLSEQQKIVEYLDTQFAKIDALKTNAEQQLQAAKDLFQSALKDLMTPKEGWEEKKLGEVAKSMADGPFGSNLKAQHYTTEREVRIVQLSNIGEFGWRDENVKYTSFEHLKTISRSEVHCGDIVIAKMMPAGRAIICPNNETKYVLSSDAVKVELKNGYNPEFIMYSINSYWFNKQVLANVSGSGRIRTSLTKLRDCNLYIPDIETQKDVVDKLNMVYMKTKSLQSNYEQTLTLCNDLKQSLLKKTFE